MVMLQKMKGEIDVGFYRTAYGFVNVGVRICAGLGAALLPAFSRRIKTGRPISKAFALCLKLALLVGLPAALGTQLLSEDIVVFLFSDAYAPSAQALAILVWSVFFILLNAALLVIACTELSVIGGLDGLGAPALDTLDVLVDDILARCGVARAAEKAVAAE